MILGISTSVFTFLHVVLSLVGILAGAIVVVGMFNSKNLTGWTALFFATTALTSVTGFFFPRDQILPSHIVGIISVVILAVALLAHYYHHAAGHWRWIYVVCAVVALYFNVFVGVVQAFLKLPLLASLAPTQSEPPFVIVQLVVLIVFAGIGFMALRSFHPKINAPMLSSA